MDTKPTIDLIAELLDRASVLADQEATERGETSALSPFSALAQAIDTALAVAERTAERVAA